MLDTISTTKVFDGLQQQVSHYSITLACQMRFSIYLPPQACADKENIQKVPVLYWLSGLTCTDENFMQKAGAQRMAAELGLAIVCADTSPRGENVADDVEAYDLGCGAGFYVNATEQPWVEHYKMYDYIVGELPALIEANFPVSTLRSISGHSMGGHGALTIALKNPERYQSVSAFSPIANPINCPWGQKAFSAYLGADKTNWQAYDASELMVNIDKQIAALVPALVDQGLADEFLAEQLNPSGLLAAALEVDYPLILNQHKGYDHSYYFIASFIENHMRFHANHLGKHT